MDFALLAGLTEDDRRALLSTAVRRRFARDEVIFHEGDLGDTFHLVAKGRVAVRVATPAGDVATLTVLGVGDGFGEQAILDAESRRSATVAALEPTETLTLTNGAFDDLRTRHATVANALVAHLAQRVLVLSAQLVEALYDSAEKRVLRRVLDLDAVYDGAAIALTQEQVATMAGTARPTANRVLQAAADDGLLALTRGRIEVLDRDALARRAR
jgi:CRP-like cAMP-binding protein